MDIPTDNEMTFLSLVMKMTGCSRTQAVDALRRSDDIVDAIMIIREGGVEDV